MRFKKTFLLFISLLMCVTLMSTGISVNAGINENQEGSANPGYDFPVKPGTDAWNKFESHYDRVTACQVPENTLRNMPTEELIETVLNYPLLMDIYAYDTLQKGFEAVAKKFNGLSELQQREDAASKLLAKYKTMKVIGDAKKITSRQLFDLSNIEVILGQESIAGKFNSAEMKELEKEAEAKYLKKKEYPDVYGFTAPTYYKVKVEKQSSVESLDTTFSVNTTYYVFTPNGTQVTVYMYGEHLTPPEILSMDNWVTTNYPGTTVLRSATTNYNCHSYAWHSQNSTNPYWMDVPAAYWQDGSYTYQGTTTGYVNEKVYYSAAGNEHSGIVSGRVTGTIGPNNYSKVTVDSKWGTYGLIRHTAQNCMYYESNLALRFYKR